MNLDSKAEVKHSLLKGRAHIQGFTLIELLVVISIMMTMLAIAAPFSIEVTDKAKAQTEFISFNNLLRKLSVTAFANGNGIRVELSEKSVYIYKENGSLTDFYQAQEESLPARVEYDYLSFPPQVLSFNKNGFATATNIRVIQRTKDKNIDLSSLNHVKK